MSPNCLVACAVAVTGAGVALRFDAPGLALEFSLMVFLLGVDSIVSAIKASKRP